MGSFMSRPVTKTVTTERSGSGGQKWTVVYSTGSYVVAEFDARTRTMHVLTISAAKSGDGSKLMADVEALASKNIAGRLETATSRPGFFKKLGFDYTAAQKEKNAVKYTKEELLAEELNRGGKGGGFIMEKSGPF